MPLCFIIRRNAGIKLKNIKQIPPVTQITSSIGNGESIPEFFHRNRSLGRKMALEVEVFFPEPKPEVRFFGAAARASGHQFANIVELISSKHHYLVVIELPQVQFCDDEIDWVVNDDGEVTIEGQITPGAIFANMPIGNKTKRVQLCPNEPWGMSFYFPGPVEWWTSSVLFTSKTMMEIAVMKARPEAAVAGGPAGVGEPTGAEIEEMIAGWFV